MTFQQSYDKIVAVICGVDTGLLNGKRERAMKEETFKNKILWYNFIMCLLVVCIHAQNMHIFLEPVPWIKDVYKRQDCDSGRSNRLSES